MSRYLPIVMVDANNEVIVAITKSSFTILMSLLYELPISNLLVPTTTGMSGEKSEDKWQVAGYLLKIPIFDFLVA